MVHQEHRQDQHIRELCGVGKMFEIITDKSGDGA
jgi:hypothetical protein